MNGLLGCNVQTGQDNFRLAFKTETGLGEYGSAFLSSKSLDEQNILDSSPVYCQHGSRVF